MSMIKIALDSSCKTQFAKKFKNQWMISHKKNQFKVNLDILQLQQKKYFKVMTLMKYCFVI